MAEPRSISRTLWLIACVLLPALFYLVGRQHGHDEATAQLIAAKVATKQARAEADATATALDTVASRLKQQRQDLAKAKAEAKQAITDRDATQRKYAALRAQRQTQLILTAHENADCADLDRPLCPAVAQRLFRPPAAPAGD